MRATFDLKVVSHVPDILRGAYAHDPAPVPHDWPRPDDYDRRRWGDPSATSRTSRLIVLTDISSLTAGEAEPDDGQSLIRLMLYTNDFDIEGLVASANLGHGQTVRPVLIRQVVDA